jgi:uncharacterized protein (DUF433 family)
MISRSFSLIGQGVYSPAEAQRLTGVPVSRISRWTRGYQFSYRGTKHKSPPLIATDTPSVDGAPVLSFLDLMELRFLNAFRKHNVSTQVIRIAAARARELLGHARPFSTRKFKTDGKNILAELVDSLGDRHLLDLVRRQYVLERVVGSFLFEGIEFDDQDEPFRWWPLRGSKSVLVDPLIAFGAPVISSARLPTRVLALAVAGEMKVREAAAWYDVTEREVRDAVRFERSLDEARSVAA